MNKVAVCIPARLHSTRVPRKLLRNVEGKPIIRHAYDRCKEFYKDRADVFVITDSSEIGETIPDQKDVVYVKDSCENGTERIAKAVNRHFAKFRGYDYFINVQGDNTKLDDKSLEDIYNAPLHLKDLACFTLGYPMDRKGKATKLLLGNTLDEDGNRRVLLAHRGVIGCPEEFDHVGVYGYSPWGLKKYLDLQHKPIQHYYDYEMMSFIENGLLCVARIDNYQTKSINFKEDLTP